MKTTINTISVINGTPVLRNVEVSIENGIGIHMVGLCDTAVKESLLRTITALQSYSHLMPSKKIVINITPSELRKTAAPELDLPIAIGIVLGQFQMQIEEVLKDFVFVGELGLDGSVRHVDNIKAIVECAKENGIKGIILPDSCMDEVKEYYCDKDITLYPTRSIIIALGVTSALLIFPPPQKKQ